MSWEWKGRRLVGSGKEGDELGVERMEGAIMVS